MACEHKKAATLTADTGASWQFCQECLRYRMVGGPWVLMDGARRMELLENLAEAVGQWDQLYSNKPSGPHNVVDCSCLDCCLLRIKMSKAYAALEKGDHKPDPPKEDDRTRACEHNNKGPLPWAETIWCCDCGGITSDGSDTWRMPANAPRIELLEKLAEAVKDRLAQCYSRPIDPMCRCAACLRTLPKVVAAYDAYRRLVEEGQTRTESDE